MRYVPAIRNIQSVFGSSQAEIFNMITRECGIETNRIKYILLVIVSPEQRKHLTDQTFPDIGPFKLTEIQKRIAPVQLLKYGYVQLERSHGEEFRSGLRIYRSASI